MKLLSLLLLSFAALTYAADQQPGQAAKTAPSGPAAKPVYKKLGAVTWDPNAHKLAWTVETGDMINGEFVPSSKKTYEISTDDATMGTSQEKRGFDNDEAEDLNKLLDILSLYCAESVEWWEAGAGEPADNTPNTKKAAPAEKPTKVNGPESPSAPKPQRVPVAPGNLIALLQGVH